MSDFDNEIEHIINDIKINEIRTFKDINEINKDMIDNIYSNYLRYKINYENKINTIQILKNKYELIDIREQIPNIWISYIDINKFYNLKIHCRGLFIKFNSPDTILLKIGKRFYKVNIHNKIFFKKLNNKDLLKIHLVESIN